MRTAIHSQPHTAGADGGHHGSGHGQDHQHAAHGHAAHRGARPDTVKGLLLCLALTATGAHAQREIFTDPGPTNITLATAVNAAATAIVVSAGHGALLPSPTLDNYFLITLRAADNSASEVLRCTARSTDTLTCARGLYGTAASFAIGATIRHGANAETMRIMQGDADALIGVSPEARACRGGARLNYSINNTGSAALGTATNLTAIVGETGQTISHPATSGFGVFATAVPHTLFTSGGTTDDGAGFFAQIDTQQGVSLRHGFLYEITFALGAPLAANNAGIGVWSELAAQDLPDLDDVFALGHDGDAGGANFELVYRNASDAATIIGLDGTCSGAPATVTCVNALPFTTANAVIKLTLYFPRAPSDSADLTTPWVGFHIANRTTNTVIAYGRVSANIPRRSVEFITAAVTNTQTETTPVTLRLYSVTGCKGWY